MSHIARMLAAVILTLALAALANLPRSKVAAEQ